MAAAASPQPIYPKSRRSHQTPPSPPPPSHFTLQAMDTMAVTSPTFYGGAGNDSSFNSCFTKFNSALTAGLLNPNSPPPCSDKVRSSPSLFEMMANEPDCSPSVQIPTSNAVALPPKPQIPPQDKQLLMQQRLSELLTCRSPGNQFNDARSSDLNLHLSSKDGFNVSMNVHKQILVAHSRYFAGKLSDRWLKLQRNICYQKYPKALLLVFATCTAL